MTASTMQGFAATHRTPITVSVMAHAILLGALSTSVVFMPDQPMQLLAIEAVIVDEGAARRAAAAEQQRAEERRQQAEAEQRRQEQLAAERRAEERRQEQLAAERRAEQQRQQQREAEARAAEERRQAQRQRQEAEAAARREQERQVAEERARQQAAQRAQERREAELAAMLAEEEAIAAARNSSAMARYVTLIAQKVERKWVQPASAVPGIECEVSVQQLPNGEVISTRVTQCNGDELVRRSVENAVLAASPLPLPEDRVLFDRNLRFTFRPQLGN